MTSGIKPGCWHTTTDPFCSSCYYIGCPGFSLKEDFANAIKKKYGLKRQPSFTEGSGFEKYSQKRKICQYYSWPACILTSFGCGTVAFVIWGFSVILTPF